MARPGARQQQPQLRYQQQARAVAEAKRPQQALAVRVARVRPPAEVAGEVGLL